MPGKLKVFRTAIGFHDAYVAAPSKKAALGAWGTDKDLFARGAAEEVTDPALMAQPLADPGTVFRRLRDTPPEPSPPKRKRVRGKGASRPQAEPVVASPPPPRPDRDAIEAAERKLTQARDGHAAEQDRQATRERELAAERSAMEERQDAERRQLEEALRGAEDDYAARLERWRKKIASTTGD